MSQIDANASAAKSGVSGAPTRQRMWNRFLLVALALHVPLFVYPILRLGQWLEAPWMLTALVLVPLTGSQLFVRMYLRGRSDSLATWLRRAADFWLGLSPLLLMALIVAEIVVALSWLAPSDAALLTLGFTIVAGGVGFIVASRPIVKTIPLASDKLTAPRRFVQITDVHIGSRSSRFLEQIVFEINRVEPDFVCITGDFIDQTGVGEDKLVSLRSIACPVYFSIGNHERYEDLDEILARLERLGVNVLRSASVLHDAELQVIGIDDMDDPGQVGRELANIDIDTERYIVLLYHRPRGLEDAAAAGVDLMLSGHTHNGQIFPFNLIVRRVFEHIVGIYRHGSATLYVSQGTGTWGPVLRFGTRAEITQFLVTPFEGET